MICYGNDSSKKYFIWRDNTKLIFKNIMLPFLASKIENWKCTFFFVPIKHVVLQDIKKFLRLGLLGCISIRFHLKHCDVPELTAWLQDEQVLWQEKKGDASFSSVCCTHWHWGVQFESNWGCGVSFWHWHWLW